MRLILTILVFLGLKVYEIGRFLLTWGLILSLFYTLPHIGHTLCSFSKDTASSHLVWFIIIFGVICIFGLILSILLEIGAFDKWLDWLSSNWEKAERITGRKKC